MDSLPSDQKNQSPLVKPMDPPRQQHKNLFLTIIVVLLCCIFFVSGINVGFYLSQSSRSGQFITGQVTTTETVPAISPSVSIIPTAFPSSDEPRPTEIVLTPTPQLATLRSSVCPVEFTVPSGRIYIPSKGSYGLWQLLESQERFTFLPRAEEFDGRQVIAELRVEGQQYGSGEASIVVECQPNPNKWNQTDFFSYVLKSDAIQNPILTKTNLWNREVGILTFTGSSGATDTVYVFSTPSMLFHAGIFSRGNFGTDVQKIFDTLAFR